MTLVISISIMIYLLLKKGVNPVELQKYTLFTVNGYVHQTDANSKGLWVEDGYKTIKKRRNTVLVSLVLRI